MKITAENKIQASFALALAIVVLFGGGAWWSAYRSFQMSREVQHSNQVKANLEGILVELLNIETGVRGYVISGENKFLEPYLMGIASVYTYLDQAKAFSDRNQHREALMTQLQDLIQQKLEFVAGTVELCRQGSIDEARQQIATGRGRQMMDTIRQIIGELEADEAAVLRRRLDQSDAQSTRTISIVLASGFIAVFLVTTAGLIVRRDFRKRKEAEDALHFASERLALATRAGNVGIWDWDVKNDTVFWDDALYENFGMRRGQVVPSVSRFFAMVHPDDVQQVREEIQKAFRGEKEYAAEFRIIWPDKSIHYLQANSVVLRDVEGTPSRMLGTNWDVTTRKLAEKKFRDLLEAAPDGVIITDQAGEITLLNNQTEKLFGYSRGELIGKSFENLMVDRLRDDITEVWKFPVDAQMQTKIPGVTVRMRRKDGSEFPADVAFSPLQTESGVLVIAAVRDVTDRVRIEDALRSGAEQQRQLAERLEVERARLAEAQAVAKVGSWELDLRTNVLTWSEENYRIFGVDRARFGASYEAFLDRIPAEDRDMVHKAFTDSIASRQPYAIDHRLQMDDGTIKYVYERCQTFYDAEGRPIRSVGTTHDITDRKLAEEALRESEETLRMLAESMPQIAWMCRPDGWNIYFNQRWVDYTGLTLEQSYGEGWNIPFHPDDQQVAWNAWKQATQAGGKYELECRLRRADGVYRWFLIRGVPVRDSAGAIIKWIGTCTDIDDVKRAEEEISALNRQLGQHSTNLEKEVSKRTAELRDSLKSLETLTYTMAHDLRAPLRGMVAYADALAEDVPLNDTGKMYAREIHQAAERMNTLVGDLLTYGQLTHLDFPIHSVDVIKQIEIVLAQLNANIRIAHADIYIQKPIPDILGNEGLLGQALWNLISNALKFVAPGVKPKIVVRGESRGPMVRIWVEDNGIGIAPRHQNKIFGVFHRLHTTEEYPGTGVGLAIAERVVNMMSGRIGVQSEPGKGAKFWIELPHALQEKRETVSCLLRE